MEVSQSWDPDAKIDAAVEATQRRDSSKESVELKLGVMAQC